MGEVLKRTRWIRPSVLRIDQVGPGSTYVLYFDGDAGWEILPGTRQVVPIAGGELEFARKYIRTYRLNTWLADQDSNNRITLLSPNRIRISNSDALDQRDITLDPSLFLPMTIATVSLSDPAHPVASEETITEWGTVHGIRFPRRWTIFRNGVRVAEAHDARHTVNSGLRVADLAEKPRDLKPALPQ
jgi:hypothetical protein